MLKTKKVTIEPKPSSKIENKPKIILKSKKVTNSKLNEKTSKSKKPAPKRITKNSKIGKIKRLSKRGMISKNHKLLNKKLNSLKSMDENIEKINTKITDASSFLSNLLNDKNDNKKGITISKTKLKSLIDLCKLCGKTLDSSKSIMEDYMKNKEYESETTTNQTNSFIKFLDYLFLNSQYSFRYNQGLNSDGNTLLNEMKF